MKDLWDLEFERVDRVIWIGVVLATGSGLLGMYLGWGWWSAAVVVGVMWISMFVVKQIERRYDLIRVENDLRSDEELFGLGWDSRKEVVEHLKTLPRYWRETHCAMPYITRNGKQRWGVVNKPRYWRDREAQEKLKKQFPPTPEEERMMEGMQARLIEEARRKGL